MLCNNMLDDYICFGSSSSWMLMEFRTNGQVKTYFVSNQAYCL